MINAEVAINIKTTLLIIRQKIQSFEMQVIRRQLNKIKKNETVNSIKVVNCPLTDFGFRSSELKILAERHMSK